MFLEFDFSLLSFVCLCVCECCVACFFVTLFVSCSDFNSVISVFYDW
jgi:hypothetical protein